MYSILDLPDKFKEETTLQYGDEISSTFLETSSYTSSVSTEKPILYLLGNKGAGKSAVLSKIFTDNKNNTIIIYFKDFYNDIEKRVKQRLSGLTDQQIYLVYEKEWEIELWFQIIIHLYTTHYRQRLAPFDMGDYEKLYRFLDKYKIPLDRNIALEVAAKISNIKVSISGFSAEVKSEEKNSQTLTEHDINKIKKHAINILGKKPTYLLIDEFDKIEKWDDTVRTSIRGLIEAIFALIRDVNKEHADGNKLIVRVAIREDMFNAAKIRYVDSQKIPKKVIDLAWSRDNLEELVAKKIRAHWGIDPDLLHRKKITYEVFPFTYSKKQDLFSFFCIVARSNPRALFALINECVQSAIDRKQAFMPSDEHPPLYVGATDVQNALAGYSDAQMDNVLDGNDFLYSSVDGIVNFLKDKASSLFSNNYIKLRDLREALLEFLEEDEELEMKIKKWPVTGLTAEEKIIRVLYDVGILGIKRNKKNTFFPERFVKSTSFVIHPTYKPVLLENSYLRISVDIEKELNNATLEVFAAIEHITRLTNPTRRTQILPAEVNNGLFLDKDIVHGIVRLIWSIRSLLKKMIAYGDQVDEIRIKPLDKIIFLENTLSEVEDLINVESESLHLLSVLYNPMDLDSWRDPQKLHNMERFEDEMLMHEHEELYSRHVQPIKIWVDYLVSKKHDELSEKLDTILVKLQKDLNSPLASSYIN